MPAGRYVCLSVTDSGTGMTDEVRAQIFEPFFTTKGRGAGTGLGLAMVYGIVKQANGFVWATSEVGVGTKIEILLPVSEDPVAADEEITETVMDDPQGGKVLLVEDEPAVLRLVERTLSRAGYEVISASSGDEALAALDENPDFDLLLTDIIMPGMSGKDLYDRLSERGLEFKTIFMSGYTDEIVAKAGVESEGHVFIQKPFTAESLIGAVNSTLRS